MAWSKSNTTQHNCGGPVFGRKTAGCPRCDELLNGATPVRFACNPAKAQRLNDIRNHDCKASRCAVICTFGDW